jgi:hypothetical protein
MIDVTLFGTSGTLYPLLLVEGMSNNHVIASSSKSTQERSRTENYAGLRMVHAVKGSLVELILYGADV